MTSCLLVKFRHCYNILFYDKILNTCKKTFIIEGKMKNYAIICLFLPLILNEFYIEKNK